jgi:hypothetical protein
MTNLEILNHARNVLNFAYMHRKIVETVMHNIEASMLYGPRAKLRTVDWEKISDPGLSDYTEADFKMALIAIQSGYVGIVRMMN